MKEKQAHETMMQLKHIKSLMADQAKMMDDMESSCNTMNESIKEEQKKDQKKAVGHVEPQIEAIVSPSNLQEDDVPKPRKFDFDIKSEEEEAEKEVKNPEKEFFIMAVLANRLNLAESY